MSLKEKNKTKQNKKKNNQFRSPTCKALLGNYLKHHWIQFPRTVFVEITLKQSLKVILSQTSVQLLLLI